MLGWRPRWLGQACPVARCPSGGWHRAAARANGQAGVA
jgi:hypothetical protein